MGLFIHQQLLARRGASERYVIISIFSSFLLSFPSVAVSPALPYSFYISPPSYVFFFLLSPLHHCIPLPFLFRFPFRPLLILLYFLSFLIIFLSSHSPSFLPSSITLSFSSPSGSLAVLSLSLSLSFSLSLSLSLSLS